MIESSRVGERGTPVYGDERKAEFLLSNAVDAEDYRRAQKGCVGCDWTTKIEHERPAGI